MPKNGKKLPPFGPFSRVVDQLDNALKQSGLTREAVAAKSGVTERTLRNLLNGDDVRLSTLQSIAGVLGMEMVLMPRGLANGIEAAPTLVASGNAPRGTVDRALARIRSRPQGEDR